MDKAVEKRPELKEGGFGSDVDELEGTCVGRGRECPQGGWLSEHRSTLMSKQRKPRGGEDSFK